MKKMSWLWMAIFVLMTLSNTQLLAQALNGTYTIDPSGSGASNFTTFASAITSLNSNGISGPVIFNVAANAVFPESPLTITATGTEVNTITFRKSGSGANPRINSTGTTGISDAIIRLSGSDYITFEQIDLYDATDRIEFGIHLYSGSVSNGCQRNTFRNMIIDLNTTNTRSAGVYLQSSANQTAGANSYNRFLDMSISDAFKGYNFEGTGYPDIENEIDKETGTSSVQNIGRAVSIPAVGIKFGGQQNLRIENTLIDNVSSVPTDGFTAGILSQGSNTDITIQGCTIQNVTNNGTTLTYGIGLIEGTNSGTVTVTGNVINNISSTATSVYGFYLQYFTTVNFTENVVSEISYTGTSNKMTSGLTIFTGTTAYITNNMFSGISSPNHTASGSTAYCAGIQLEPSSSGMTCYVFNNSIFLNYTALSATNRSAAIVFNANPTMTLKNNILVNTTDVSVNGHVAVALYRNSTANPSRYASESNNNIFYAGTPSFKNLLFYNNTTAVQTMDDYKLFFDPRESVSTSELPPFLSSASPYNLHLNPAIPTYAESRGQRITTPIAIITDIDTDIRALETGYAGTGTAPDVGADEINGIYKDTDPPVITYTQLENTYLTSNREFTATIADYSGVPVTGTLQPRLYYKKNDAAGFVSTQGVLESGNTNSGTWRFTFDYSLIGSVISGDIIRYFVVAQDIVSTPNIITEPTGGVATDVNTVSSHPAPYTFTIRPSISGAKTVGVGGNYTTITAALTALENSVITGAVVLNLIDPLYSTNETFPLTIPVLEGVSDVNTVTLKPASGINAVIRIPASSGETDVFRIAHGDYFILDGSNNGTDSRNLTIDAETGSLSRYGVNILGGIGYINSIMIKNCHIIGSSNTTATTGINCGSSSAPFASEDLLIENNLIEKCANGIIVASNEPYHVNTIIRNNVIGSTLHEDFVTCVGIQVSGVSPGQISGNRVFNIDTNEDWSVCGIKTGNYVDGLLIEKNLVYNIISRKLNYGAAGIELSGSTSVFSISLVNNVIHTIHSTNSSASSLVNNPFGIVVRGGTGIQIMYNSVHLHGKQIDVGTSVSFSASLLIAQADLAGLQIRNNTFYNQKTGRTNSESYSVFCVTPNLLTSDYNNLFVSGPDGILAYYTIPITTIASWRTLTSNDAHSISADPKYFSPSDLRPVTVSPLLGAGTPVGSVLTDFSGVSRSLTAPTIGAYENGIAGGPSISYTLLEATTGHESRTLNGVTVTDPSGIGSGSLSPRIYWRVNNGSWQSSQGTLNGGLYDFTVNTSNLNPQDYVYYFIIAQNAGGVTTAEPGTGLIATDVNTIAQYPDNPNYYLILDDPNYGGGTVACGGYFYANSTDGANNAASKPTYEWIDFSGHTLITSFTSGNDDGYFTIPDLGFNFTFFENTYRTNNVYICTNGFISFGSGSTSSGAYGLPETSEPNNIAAGFFGDLVTSTTTDKGIFWHTDGTRAVITYYKSTRYDVPADMITFQIILYSNGNIKYQYNDALSNVSSAFDDEIVIGIEDENGLKGIGYRIFGSGGPLFSSPLAVQFGKDQNALPVEISLFEGRVHGREVVLTWETASEKNAHTFLIERKLANEELWSAAGEVKASGNSNSPKSYQYEDKKLQPGSYYYRLKMIDSDGSFEYSEQIEVVVGVPEKFALSQNYPNPFNPSTRLDYQLPVDAKVQVLVYSVTGELVETIVNQLQPAGYYTTELKNTSRWSSGVYFIRMVADGVTGQRTFSDIKKVMLLK